MFLQAACQRIENDAATGRRAKIFVHRDPYAELIDAIRRAVGNPNLTVRPMPWWLMRLLSSFVPLFRELTEMRYLWNVPVRMDNARLTAALGAEPHTPLDVAVRKTLIGLGCLPDDRASGS